MFFVFSETDVPLQLTNYTFTNPSLGARQKEELRSFHQDKSVGSYGSLRPKTNSHPFTEVARMAALAVRAQMLFMCPIWSTSVDCLGGRSVRRSQCSSLCLNREAGRNKRSSRRNAYHKCSLQQEDIAMLRGKKFAVLAVCGLGTKFGPLRSNALGVLQKTVRLTLQMLERSSRFPWPSLLFIGSYSDNSVHKADKPSLGSKWLPLLRRSGLVFVISSAILALLVVSGPNTYALQPTWALTEENLLFLEAWRTVDRAFVDKSFNGQSWFRYREDALRREPMRTREETYVAIRKMLGTLDDPFTRFLEPDKFKSLKLGTNGALTGVGLEVSCDVSIGGISEDLVVVSPVSGGPADRAGILPGDVILAIDGYSTQGMGLYDAARRLQGPLDSQVELTLLNRATTTPRTVTIQRENITLNPVSWKMCELTKGNQGSTKLGYIRLSTFNQNSSRAVKAAIRNLRESGATSFVLDIRNNSGGLFPAGIEIAKLWLDKGVIVYITDSMGIRDIYETDGEDAIATTEPLIVLVNKGTASASEILAGALKDNKRAVIIGEPTFGKGRIQSIFQLSDGSGMAVTVARYETPAHVNIDKVGITPDYPLSVGAPVDEESFCRFLEDSSASSVPKLFAR